MAARVQRALVMPYPMFVGYLLKRQRLGVEIQVLLFHVLMYVFGIQTLQFVYTLVCLASYHVEGFVSERWILIIEWFSERNLYSPALAKVLSIDLQWPSGSIRHSTIQSVS